jgi:hypothetical protein
MSKNLITAQIITPTQWPLARVWLEVSALLGTAPRQIEQLEFWPHVSLPPAEARGHSPSVPRIVGFQ